MKFFQIRLSVLTHL